MQKAIVGALLGIFISSVAAAADCARWRRLDESAKVARVDQMIEGHLNSNVGKRYTSENVVLMRRCLDNFADDIRAQFDGACDVDANAEMGVMDKIFDRYFLSCVQ
jgi:hypothetical protein